MVLLPDKPIQNGDNFFKNKTTRNQFLSLKNIIQTDWFYKLNHSIFDDFCEKKNSNEKLRQQLNHRNNKFCINLSLKPFKNANRKTKQNRNEKNCRHNRS